MNHIELFDYDQNKQSTEKQVPTNQSLNIRINQKRPQNLTITKNLPTQKRWRQCKTMGKNISIRSYSAACTFKNKLYIYGGYQILKGIMADFYCIDLDQQLGNFYWENIEGKGDLPGPRSKHALIGTRNKIYMVGGLISNFNPIRKIWTLLKPEGQKLPPIDSFGCVYISTSDDEKIIIITGYNAQKAQNFNSVYQYNITKNKINILFQGTPTLQLQTPQNTIIPAPRNGSAATTDGTNIYIFGGKDSQQRMNDLWQFNINDHQYRKMDDKGNIPTQRNGHTLEYYQGKLYMFGGIHDITWQLDDLHIYNINKRQWITLEHDSPRKIQRKKGNVGLVAKEKTDKKSPKRKNWHDNVNSLYSSKSPSEYSPGMKYLNINDKNQQNSPNIHSPGKMLDQQRKKVFLQKKAAMLKNFEVDKKDQEKYLLLETSSQAMKNSLDIIGQPNPKNKYQGKLTQFGKQSTSKFLLPLQNVKNQVYGKKPCARDGHCAVILNKQLIIFGGDRHQMSFNDIYKLRFQSFDDNE